MADSKGKISIFNVASGASGCYGDQHVITDLVNAAMKKSNVTLSLALADFDDGQGGLKADIVKKVKEYLACGTTVYIEVPSAKLDDKIRAVRDMAVAELEKPFADANATLILATGDGAKAGQKPPAAREPFKK